MQNIYEIKTGRGKWIYVLADNFKAVADYCKAKGCEDYRMVGKMSSAEIEWARHTAKKIW